MKLKFLLILAAGTAFAGCNSNSKTENMTDSTIVADTIVPVDSVVVDTTPVTDTALVDSL